MKHSFLRLSFIGAGLAVLLASCGGDSGTASSGGPGGSSTPPTASVALIGTAATGAALANAPVSITNAAGTSPCVETSISTDALGSYLCTLKAGETAPFFVVVTDPTGNLAPLVSVSTTTPAAGTRLTVNATPLTTAIVAQLAPDGNPLSLVSAGNVDSTALQSVTTNVLAQLAPVLATIGLSGYDPFTTSITAATAEGAGNTADLVLDVVKVVTDPATGQLALSTIDNPTPVVLATASSTGATLPPPDTAVSTLSQALQVSAKAFNSCFAVPLAQRVLARNTAIPMNQGSPEVTDGAPECLDIAADPAVAGGVDFLHNGYNAGQFFYSLLNSPSMTGAQFSAPEVMAFYPKNAAASAGAADSYDRAVVNLRFLDANGDPGNVITVAARIPNTATATRPTDWWLVGNQQEVDTFVRLNIRRFEQLNSAAPAGRFQTGVMFMINQAGPGSMLGGQPLNMARVTGPGLPAAGVVYGRSNGSQGTMDLFNKTGSLTAGSLCNTGGTTVNCPNLWFERTQGTTGTAATTLGTNPSNGVNGLIWAQPGDGFDPSKFVNGTRYQIELFYGSNTGTADRVVFKTLVSDLVRATQGVNLPWNTPGPRTLAALDPSGSLTGAQTNLTVDWVQNVSAQQIAGITAAIDMNGASIGPNKPVPRGATSGVLSQLTVPAFTATSTRSLVFSYRMSDGSGKSMFYNWN